MKSVNLKYTQKVQEINVDKLCDFVDEIMENKTDIITAIKTKSDSLQALAQRNTEIAVKLLKDSK